MKFTVKVYRVLLPPSQCVHFGDSNGVLTAVQTLVPSEPHYNVQPIVAKLVCSLYS